MNVKIKIGVVVTNKYNDVLLIKEKIEKRTMPLWNIVKGTYEDNESIFQAAIRECEEEASIRVELTHSLGVTILKEKEQLKIQFNFLASIKKGVPKIPVSKDQLARNEIISEVKFFTKEDFLKMKPEDFISDNIFQVLKNWANGELYPLEVYKSS